MSRKIDSILEDIGVGVMYNLHAHTQFCDGRASMEDLVEKASSMGFTHFGFTPHSPIPYASTCNMSKEDVPVYLSEIDRLQAKYPDVKLLKGMEIDYMNKQWGPSHEYFKEMPLDYAIGSVHFIPTQDGELVDIDGSPERFKKNLDEKFHGDLGYVVETFFKSSMEMVEAGGFEIIGHFDKIRGNASTVNPNIDKTPEYRRMLDELIDAITDKNLVVEINTKAFDTRRLLFPAQYTWRTLLDRKIPVVVNSDTHYIDKINASRPEVFKALRYLKDTIK